MLDRTKQIQILVESNRRSLALMFDALEAFETGSAQRTAYTSLQRSFHTVKHDAAHLRLTPLARLAGACEAIVESVSERGLPPPLALLRSAATEIRVATEVLAGGQRHRLDAKLLNRVELAAKKAGVA